MADFENNFSWSMSRANKFRTCPRAYYFHYYGSWGGWKKGASPRVRELWLLKKLTSRRAWAGTAVHETIAWSLEQARVRGRLPEAEDAVAGMHEQMRSEFRESRSGAWRFRRAMGLIEHAYEEQVDDEVWRDNFQHAKLCLENFFRSPVAEEMLSVPFEQWLPIDSLATFTLNGFTAYVAPDFAFRDADGRLRIIDWKTGAQRDGDKEQVRGYVLFALDKWGAKIEETTAELHYLGQPAVVVAEVTSLALDSFREEAMASIQAMRERLLDTGANLAEEAAFEPTPNSGACRRCNFKGVCGAAAT